MMPFSVLFDFYFISSKIRRFTHLFPSVDAARLRLFLSSSTEFIEPYEEGETLGFYTLYLASFLT